uniref:Trefoil factor 2 n=1 Tax=Aquila chrysaetos chrysaetos TaxID=223781 RepID=A0A663EFM8_AQUCH
MPTSLLEQDQDWNRSQLCLSSVLTFILSSCQCKMAPRERKNCGYPGISAEECKKAGCCFSDSVAGVPWCFAPKAKKGNISKVCPNNPHARVNCGFPGISATDCKRKGCCFMAQPAGVPWCFYHHMVEEGNRCSYQTHIYFITRDKRLCFRNVK